MTPASACDQQPAAHTEGARSARRYRLLILSSHPVQYASPLYRLLARHPQIDLQVAYCSLRGAEPGHDPEFGTTVQWDVPLLDGYQWTHLPNRGSGSEGFFGLCNPGVWKLIRAGKFDAVICYTGYIRATFWIARLAALLSGSAFLFGTDAVALRSMDGSRWKGYAKRAFWPLLYRAATQVIVPSTGSVELMSSLGIPRKRVSMLPYVVDNDWWMSRAAAVEPGALRRTLGIPEDAFVVLFCAKLQPWKRPADVLEAFAEAHLPGAFLIFAGEGPLRASLEQEVQRRGLSACVRFLGFANQSELPAIYSMADILVLPSQYDAFGVVVNEAICCGCPVAVSDQVGARGDLVLPVDPGFVFPVGDAHALATLLRDVCANPVRLDAFRAVALDRVRAWSPERNVAATVETVQIAAARRRSVRA